MSVCMSTVPFPVLCGFMEVIQQVLPFRSTASNKIGHRFGSVDTLVP